MNRKSWSIALLVGLLTYEVAALSDVVSSPITNYLISDKDKILTPATYCAIPSLLKAPAPPTTTAGYGPVLGWIQCYMPGSLCGGYFYEPPEITAVPNPPPIGTTETTIKAAGPSSFAESGVSTLEGNVVVTQPGREVTANKVVIYRSPETGKFTKIDLEGDVRFREAGKLIVGETAHFDLAKHTAVISDGAYHIIKPATYGPLDAWGVAEEAYRDAEGILQFTDATYTTCSPTHDAWYLKASRVTLNKETGRGSATNVRIYGEDIPFFYLPYIDFPIDKRRYSGFLNPNFGYDENSGLIFGIPYYFNLAPNYDATVTATEMTNRNVQLGGLFRYLTEYDQGYLYSSILPSDREFGDFRSSAPFIYPPSSFNTPFLDQLAKDSDTRSYSSFHDSSTFNEHWSSSLDLNYVTDAYYFQDLGSNPFAMNYDQLLNQAEVNYQSEHWNFLTRLQMYQTLHLINDTFALDQYQRLPQLDLNASYPQQAYGLDLGFNSEFVDFQHADDFFTDLPYPTGPRLNLNPTISWPQIAAAGYITPMLQLETTAYSVSNNGVLDVSVSPPTIIPDPNPDLNKVRTLPMFDIDSGLYLERMFSFFHHDYRQTIEPRVFYLFVPATNQNNIPVYDTTLPTFSFDELYRTNRFVGYDRIGDANQLSVGLTTRFLDEYTNEDKLDVSVGEILYFRKHTVCLYPDCSDDPTIDDQVSPIAGQLVYNFRPQWHAIGNIAWDPNKRMTDNDSLHVQYIPAPRHIIDFGYDYVRNGDVLNAEEDSSSVNSLNRIDLGTSWPINEHWSAVGDYNYNISHHHPQTYLYGVEYDSCCWAVRLVASRTLAAEDIEGNTTFRSAYYVQFLLKGLGSAGNSDAGGLLMSTIPGYQDIFRG